MTNDTAKPDDTEPEGDVIRLVEPIRSGDDYIDELRLRPFRLRMIRGLGISFDSSRFTAGHLIDELLTRMVDQPPSVLDELGLEDTAALFAAVFERLGKYLPTSGSG